MKTKIIAIVLLAILVIAGLLLFPQIQEREAFKDVKIDFEGVEIKHIGAEQITLNLNLKAYNPNKIRAALDGADYEVYLNNVYMGNGSINKKITILPYETKIIKSEINIRYENLNNLLNITKEIVKNNGKVYIMIKGNAYADFIGRISFPFKVEKEIDLSEEVVKKIKELKNFENILKL